MMMEKILSRSVRIICSSSVIASISMLSQPVFAQETVQKIEITGSSIKRVQAEGASAVQVLSRADIEKLGKIR